MSGTHFAQLLFYPSCANNGSGESEEAVVKGMNARFWLAPTKTVFPYRIGTTQDERWDRKFHTDITSKEETTDGFWEDDQFVQWRWVSLLGPVSAPPPAIYLP